MNKIALASPHLAILGSGSTWQNVLDEIPIKEYSMIHGQCLSVGVGGYILGKIIKSLSLIKHILVFN